jgi:hypothetical protein
VGEVPAVNEVDRREKLLAAFDHLASLVEPEGYGAVVWLLKFQTAQDILSDTGIDDDAAIGAVLDLYRRMHRGGRNFGDFFLWREDGRVAARQRWTG